MSQYRNITIIVDPAMKRTTAFHRGVELARKTGAALTLLLVDYNPALFRARFLDPELLQKAVRGYLGVRRQWLDKEVKALEADGVRATGIAAWHKPAYEEIARQVLEREPDLVIKDVEPTGRLSRAMFTPADWHLMRMCPAPLMLVNEHSSSYPQRILAAVDPFDTHDKPSDLNDVVLQAALGMAYQCDAPVHVVHAYQYLPAAAPMGAETAFADARLFEQVREDHQREFVAFGKNHGIPEERLHLLEGEPETVIAELAEDINADLVVLGSVERRGLKRVLMGSTAEDILGSIRSDVLVVKPEGFREALRSELEEVNKERRFPEPWEDFRRFSL